jgi:hypothetical protein
MRRYMGGLSSLRNKASGTFVGRCSLLPLTASVREAHMQDRERTSTGPNEEPVNETIAGTGPGIPDDALAPGEEELPKPPTDEEVEEAAEALDVPGRERDTLPLEGE